MTAANEIILSLVKPGDTVKVKPISKCPNMGGVFKVNCISKTGLVYGLSKTSDGYECPFWAIDKIKIIGE